MTANPLGYDPGQRYEVRTWDVEYRRAEQEPLKARIYQPQGTGPFPLLLDVHGAVWNGGDRAQNELLDQDLAASGLVVAAIDFRLAPHYPYPAQVTDVNYATRWLKAHAREFNADPHSMGGLGTSSGGHTILLSALLPHDPRYSAFSLEEDRAADATLRYVLALWPVLDPYARYLYAQENDRARLVTWTESYFRSQETMKEGNPQLILERGETTELPPMLIVQPTPDEMIPEAIPKRFVTTYRAAGGPITLEWFPGSPHGFARTPGPETDRALALMKNFVASQLAVYAVDEQRV